MNRRHFIAGAVAAAVTLSEKTAAAAGQNTATAKRTMVQTVLGPLDTAKLGFTQSHQHVCSGSPGLWQAWPEIYGGYDAFVKKAVALLKQGKAEGLDSFVDCTTFDLGRNIRLLEEVSRKSGVQIIACTGHWLDPSRSMNARTIDELVDFFTHEIEVGIEGTPIKAGVIKVATDVDVIPFGERTLRAAARTSKATGTPITTHTSALDRVGEKQADIFEQEGASPSKICIGHCDDNPDLEYIAALAKRGYWIGMDRLPGGLPLAPGTPPPARPVATLAQRYACVKGLIDRGYLNQVTLGTDGPIFMSLVPVATMKALDLRNPDSLLFVRRKALSGLKAIGVTDAQIHTMTVENPKRFFDRA